MQNVQKETSSIPQTNIYGETFKMHCLLAEKEPALKPEIVELMLIHIGLLHNAMGMAIMELVKVYSFLSQKKDVNHKKDNPINTNTKEESLCETSISREKIKETKTSDSNPLPKSTPSVKKPETTKINEKTQGELFSSAESLRNNIINTETTEEKPNENKEISSHLPVNRLTVRIQNNNKKSSFEKINEALQISESKDEESLPLKKEPPKDFLESLLFPPKNSLDKNSKASFLSQGLENLSSGGIPLAYTKNFKKKKSEDILGNFELKRIKENINENSNSSIQSKKPSFFKSKRKFVINQPLNDAMQLTQSQKAEEIGDFLNKVESKEKNQSHSIGEFSNPFRHVYRKKEEREKLTGFACDQCEKFYKALGRGHSLDPKNLCKCTSRHKDLFEIHHTPEVFYEEEVIKFENDRTKKT